MKIRNGFVSNSSSSSFICNVCGGIESGYDESLRDLGMQMCEHEHYYHTGHSLDNFMEAGKDVWYNYLKKQQQVSNATSTLLYSEEELNKLENDYIELDEDDFFDKYGDTLYDLISEFGVPEEYCPVCSKIKEYKQDPDWEKYLELKKKFNDISL